MLGYREPLRVNRLSIDVVLFSMPITPTRCPVCATCHVCRYLTRVGIFVLFVAFVAFALPFLFKRAHNLNLSQSSHYNIMPRLPWRRTFNVAGHVDDTLS